MELEFFCKPDTDLEWFAYWKQFCINWLKTLGLKEDEMAGEGSFARRAFLLQQSHYGY